MHDLTGHLSLREVKEVALWVVNREAHAASPMELHLEKVINPEEIKTPFHIHDAETKELMRTASSLPRRSEVHLNMDSHPQYTNPPPKKTSWGLARPPKPLQETAWGLARPPKPTPTPTFPGAPKPSKGTPGAPKPHNHKLKVLKEKITLLNSRFHL
jgi:hypothetical protein